MVEFKQEILYKTQTEFDLSLVPFSKSHSVFS